MLSVQEAKDHLKIVFSTKDSTWSDMEKCIDDLIAAVEDNRIIAKLDSMSASIEEFNAVLKKLKRKFPLVLGL